MKSKILIFILLLTMSCQHKNENKRLIKDFVASLSDNNISTQEIISKHIELDQVPLDKKAIVDSVLSLQVNSLRIFAKNFQKPYNIYTYEKAKRKALSGFFEISEDELKNVYFLECKNLQLIPFKISDDHRILSFSTIKKGNRRYFLNY